MRNGSRVARNSRHAIDGKPGQKSAGDGNSNRESNIDEREIKIAPDFAGRQNLPGRRQHLARWNHDQAGNDARTAKNFQNDSRAGYNPEPHPAVSRHAGSFDSARPMAFMDSSRKIVQRRAMTAPNRASSTMRESRFAGQPVGIISSNRPGRADIDRDAIGKHCRFIERVGNQQNRCSRFAPQAKQFVAHEQTRLLVERGKWFIQQNQARLQDERPRDAHALAHPARKLRGIGLREIR